LRHRRRDLYSEPKIARDLLRMADVTTEIVTLGHCNGLVKGRGRLASEVREAREKLTWTPLSECGFDIELLRLFAKGRRSAAPALAAL
jgi:hypothetical protein